MRDARIRNGVLDLRRCKRCGKLPRGRHQQAQAEQHKPFCSYNCQEWARVEGIWADERKRKELGS